MKIVKKSTIIQASILTTTLLLNSGCFFGYFGDQIVPSKQKPVETVTTIVPEPIQQQVIMAETIPTPIEVRRAVPTPMVTKVMPHVVVKETTVKKYIPPVRTLPEPVLECSDDINAENNCDKGLIEETDLQPKNQNSLGGEVHKLRSIQGQSITIIEKRNGFIFPQYPNKIVIIEMFGKKCPHCMKEMPILNRVRNKYKGKIEIIAIQVEDKMSPAEAKHLIRKLNIHYPIIPGDTATNLQYNIQNTYGWTGILPFTLVIKDGINEFTYPGEVSYNQLNKDIRSILR